MPETNRRNIEFIAVLLGLIVGVYGLELLTPADLLLSHGLVPRTRSGLPGIVTMPFLHVSLAHLLGNLTPLATLLLFMLVFHARRLIEIVILLILVGGSLLWLFGRSTAVHVGASGLIYGLAGFMLVAGFARGRFLEVVGSILVAVLYGGALFWGMLPIQPDVSWDGHLAGAAAGALLGLASGAIRKQASP